MCRFNIRMVNYINSTTHRNKLTKEINKTQLKQTKNKQKQNTKQTKQSGIKISVKCLGNNRKLRKNR